jgi:CubicO group peptidase (beta-lactamase class C family)
MKKFFAVFAIALSITSITIAPFTFVFANTSIADNSVEARIKRIENGLVPPLVTQHTKPMRLEDRMRHFKVPGVSIAVIENGKVAWARGYGVRDLETKTPVNAETVFQAASISKPVSAMAALKFVEMGKLNLDEDVNKKLSSWKVPENGFTEKEKVTLRRILTHRAGLTTSGFPGYVTGDAIPSVVQILDGIKPANTQAVRVDILPQSQMRYSGGGMTVMQQLLVDVGGKPFPQQLEEMMLKPIGMTLSAFVQPLAGPLAENASSAHEAGKVVKGKYHTYPELAAAGLWTTPTDLARFAIELQQAAAGKSSRVLSQKMAQEMLTSQGDNWGLGIVLQGKGAQQRFMHSGSNQGFNCHMLAFKETGAGVVIMTNANSGRAVIEELLRAVANEYGWQTNAAPRRTIVDLPVESLTKYVGFYQGVGEGPARVRLDGNELIAHGNGRWSKLLAGSDTTFFAVNDGAQFYFSKKPNGEIGSVTITDDVAVSAPYPRGTEPPISVASTPFYLRGSMNDWSTKNQMIATGKDRYSTSISLKPGSYEFKLGSEDFNIIDLGGSPAMKDVSVGAARILLPVGRNLKLNIVQEGVYEFVLDVVEPLEPVLVVNAKE